MNEHEPNEIPLEARNAEIKNLIMKELGWTDEEWTEEYMLALSNFGFDINQADGSPSIPEAIVPSEIEEAAYNYLYQIYIVEETGEDPLGVFPKKETLKSNSSKELTRRKEAGELEPFDYEVIYLEYMKKLGEPLTRKDLEKQTGSQAVVITREELVILGSFDIVLASGEIATIDSKDIGEDDQLIIFPEELGEIIKSETN